MAGFDIVGDVHGQAGALARLLDKLGYDDWGHHPEKRRAVFVGDLNDKGPDSFAVTARVKAWVEAGRAHAVLGNHELNAVAWNVPAPGGGWLRAHSNANRRQHASHLAQARRDPWTYREHLAFYRRLPTHLDADGFGGDFRVVHACWHAESVAVLESELDGPLSDADMARLYAADDPLSEARRLALNAPEVPLPKSLHYRDAQGKLRRRARMKWWAPDGASLAELCLFSGGAEPPKRDLKALRLRQPKRRIRYTGGVPVFFGHYHLRAKPKLTSARAICTDFGAGSGRWLAAYRWSGGVVSDANWTRVKVAS